MMLLWNLANASVALVLMLGTLRDGQKGLAIASALLFAASVFLIGHYAAGWSL